MPPPALRQAQGASGFVLNVADLRRRVARLLSCGLKPSLRTCKPRRGLRARSRSFSPQYPGATGVSSLSHRTAGAEWMQASHEIAWSEQGFQHAGLRPVRLFILDDCADDVIEIEGRAEAGERREARNIRHAASHVLEPGFVGMLIGHQHNRR